MNIVKVKGQIKLKSTLKSGKHKNEGTINWSLTVYPGRCCVFYEETLEKYRISDCLDFTTHLTWKFNIASTGVLTISIKCWHSSGFSCTHFFYMFSQLAFWVHSQLHRCFYILQWCFSEDMSLMIITATSAHWFPSPATQLDRNTSVKESRIENHTTKLKTECTISVYAHTGIHAAILFHRDYTSFLRCNWFDRNVFFFNTQTVLSHLWCTSSELGLLHQSPFLTHLSKNQNSGIPHYSTENCKIPKL